MVFYQKYPQKVYDFIRDNPEIKGKDLKQKIKELFGLDISRNTLYNLHSHHALGKPYKHGTYPPSWHLKPLGTERKDKDGYILVRVDGGEKRKHFIEWEKYHEPKKADEVILFLDGNKENCDISNLFLTKRKYLSAMNWILKGEKDVEKKKAALIASMLMIEAHEKEIILQKGNKHHKPKDDRWRDIVSLYDAGKLPSEIAKELNRNIASVRWTIRRYRNGAYSEYI